MAQLATYTLERCRLWPLFEEYLEVGTSNDEITFGSAITQARKSKGMSQKELAARIKREEDVAISPQYLNDIEHNRRNPSSDYLVVQFAKILEIDKDYLYYLADRFPKDIRGTLSEQQVSHLMRSFRKRPRLRG